MSVSHTARRTQVVLGLTVLAGLSHAVLFPAANPPQIGLATDVYYHTGQALLEGTSIYEVHPPAHPGYTFLYPPIVALATIPYALAGSELAAYVLGWSLNLVAVAALARITLTLLESRGTELRSHERVLVVAPFALAAPAVTTLVIGQVNILLTAGFAYAALGLENDRQYRAGTALGLAALVKLFPALTGAWLLRCRAWSGVLAAIATGIGGLLVGAIVLGWAPLEVYVTEVIPGQMAVGAFPDGPAPRAPYIGIRRQLSVLAPGLPSNWLLPVAIGILALPVLASYRSMATLVDRLVALEATVVAMILALPLEPFYASLVLFPTLPLVVLLEGRRGHLLLLLGTLMAMAPVTLAGLERRAGALGVADLVMDVLTPVFGFLTPAGLGLWLLLGGCVWYQYDRPVT
jgi:hypothetical protein